MDLGDELDLAGPGGGDGRKDEQEEDGRSVQGAERGEISLSALGKEFTP